jgi:hypothetical protein
MPNLVMGTIHLAVSHTHYAAKRMSPPPHPFAGESVCYTPACNAP